MIYEYALDPALVSRWHDRREYLFFEEKFGITTRRLVSIYPKKAKWNKMIWEAFQAGSHAADENAKMRLSALIWRLTEEAVKRKSTFSEIPAWLDRAEAEHRERPFRAILTSMIGRNHPAVIEIHNLIANGHELWNVPGLPTVRRRASEVAEFIAPVLRVCKHAIFVDPYFDPNKLRFRKPFEAIIRKIYEYRDESDEVTIELHTGIERFFKSPSSPTRNEENEHQKYQEVLNTCCNKLPSIVPRGVKIRVVIWKERENGQELHNRFVLTELAGILLATGLDECSNPDSETMDNVILLPKEQRNDCWRHYEKTNPAFDYAGDSFEIIGQC